MNDMMVVKSLSLIFFIIILPVMAGGYFSDRISRKDLTGMAFAFVSGQMTLWAAFQMMMLPCILKRLRFEQIQIPVVAAYILVSTGGAVCYLFRCRRDKDRSAVSQDTDRSGSGVLLLITVALMIFQVVMAIVYTYNDGDDAFYVAQAVTETGGARLYEHDPYTGLTTGMLPRYALAPFPVWLAFVAFVSGIRTVVVAHIVIPVFSIVMAYCIFTLAAEELFGAEKGKKQFYVIVSAILMIFGGYSIYSAEQFFVARSRQGKAALAGLVIPFLFYLMLRMQKELKTSNKPSVKLCMLIEAVVIAGSLCSTLGSVICLALVWSFTIVECFSKKKASLLLAPAVISLPALFIIYLYLKMSGAGL